MRLTTLSFVAFALLASGCAGTLQKPPALSAPANASIRATRVLTAHDQVTETEILGRIFLEPNEMHLGVWRDVAICLGILNPPRPWYIYWGIADAIKTPDGFLAYGVTEVRDNRILGVTMEAPFWFNTAVVSHEIVHVLSGSLDHEGPEWDCVMHIGVGLEARRIEEVR